MTRPDESAFTEQLLLYHRDTTVAEKDRRAMIISIVITAVIIGIVLWQLSRVTSEISRADDQRRTAAHHWCAGQGYRFHARLRDADAWERRLRFLGGRDRTLTGLRNIIEIKSQPRTRLMDYTLIRGGSSHVHSFSYHTCLLIESTCGSQGGFQLNPRAETRKFRLVDRILATEILRTSAPAARVPNEPELNRIYELIPTGDDFGMVTALFDRRLSELLLKTRFSIVASQNLIVIGHLGGLLPYPLDRHPRASEWLEQALLVGESLTRSSH